MRYRKVPAKTVLGGLKLIERDMLGFGLAVDVVVEHPEYAGSI